MSYLDLHESKILRREWDSMETFLRDVKTKPVLSGTHCSVAGQGGIEWYGTETWDDALHQSENGWPEGLSKIEKLTKTIKYVEGEKADRHATVFAECGDEVDVGRYVTNEPECMMDFKVIQVPAAGRVVKIITNMGASCGLEAKSLFLRGAAAVILADVIEQAGLRSEIWIVSAATNYDHGYDYRMLVKAADQPLELDQCAFSLASPAMFRRLMFRAFEQTESELFSRHIGSSYGSPANAKKEPGSIEVDALQYGFGNNLTDETVPKFVNAMVEKYFET
jgi:hypothetical protein